MAFFPGFDPADEDLPGTDDFRWVKQFAFDEVHPFLVDHRATAIDKWSRWLAVNRQQQRDLNAWNADREKLFAEIAKVKDDDRLDPKTCPKGFVAITGVVYRYARDDGRWREFIPVECQIPNSVTLLPEIGTPS